MKRFLSGRQSLILLGLWLAFLVSFIARLAWSSIMPLANTSLCFTPEQGSSYITAFYLGYVITVLPGGLLSDKFGYRKILLGSLLGMAVFTGLMSLVQTYWFGFLLRFLLGVSAGPVQSSCLSAISEHFSENQRGTATGIFMTSTSLGISIVNLYAPTLSTSFGWTSVFLATAAIPVFVCVYCSFVVRGTGEHSTASAAASNVDQKAIRISSAASQNTLSVGETLLQLCRNKNIMLLCVAGLFATGATWGITNWTNLFMVNNVGITPVQAGSVMVIYGIAAFISKPTIGIISDKIKLSKNVTAAICLFLLAPFIIFFALSSNLSILYVTGPLLGIGAFMYSPLTNALSIQLAPTGRKATTAGFVNLFNQIGSLASPLLLGRVLSATGSYQSALMVISVFPVISTIALLFIRLKKQQ